MAKKHCSSVDEFCFLTPLYIGLYGNPTSDGNKAITQRAELMVNRRRQNLPLAVSYFDASTAQVWGH